MLRNCSEVFISQCSSRKFLDTLEDVLQSSRTSPVVRERLMEVLAGAAYSNPSSEFGSHLIPSSLLYQSIRVQLMGLCQRERILMDSVDYGGK